MIKCVMYNLNVIELCSPEEISSSVSLDQQIWQD